MTFLNHKFYFIKIKHFYLTRKIFMIRWSEISNHNMFITLLRLVLQISSILYLTLF